MNHESDEALAVARVADAVREVLSASESLTEQVKPADGARAQTLPLARLAAAINELEAARAALDDLLARKSMH